MNTNAHEYGTSSAIVWTAVAERSGDTAFGEALACKSGVALRFPPQSKTRDCGFTALFAFVVNKSFQRFVWSVLR